MVPAMKILTFSLAAFAVLVPSLAEARCPERVGVMRGDTLSGIATACGIDLERLRRHNPGISAQALQPGTFLTVPPPALPTPQRQVYGTFGVAPPLVATPPHGASNTVIMPPRPLPPQQFDILPGFLPQQDPLQLPGHPPRLR